MSVHGPHMYVIVIHLSFTVSCMTLCPHAGTFGQVIFLKKSPCCHFTTTRACEHAPFLFSNLPFSFLWSAVVSTFFKLLKPISWDPPTLVFSHCLGVVVGNGSCDCSRWQSTVSTSQKHHCPRRPRGDLVRKTPVVRGTRDESKGTHGDKEQVTGGICMCVFLYLSCVYFCEMYMCVTCHRDKAKGIFWRTVSSSLSVMSKTHSHIFELPSSWSPAHFASYTPLMSDMKFGQYNFLLHP